MGGCCACRVDCEVKVDVIGPSRKIPKPELKRRRLDDISDLTDVSRGYLFFDESSPEAMEEEDERRRRRVPPGRKPVIVDDPDLPPVEDPDLPPVEEPPPFENPPVDPPVEDPPIPEEADWFCLGCDPGHCPYLPMYTYGPENHNLLELWRFLPSPWSVPYTSAYNPTGLAGHKIIQDNMDFNFNRYGKVGHGIASLAFQNAKRFDLSSTGPSAVFPLYQLAAGKTEEQKAQYRMDFFEYIWPSTQGSNFEMRGLRQLYEEVRPFANEMNPTIAEFEYWWMIVLNHFRYLAGLGPAIPSRWLYLQVAWAHERKNSTYWDASYPGVSNSAYGPCPAGSQIHCGATFEPSPVDQLPYYDPLSLPDLGPYVPSRSEAIVTNYYGTAILQMSRNLYEYMRYMKTGLPIGGHAQTMTGRKCYGVNLARSKWGGPVYPPPPGYIY